MPNNNSHRGRNIILEKLENASQKLGIRVKPNPNKKMDIPVDKDNEIGEFLQELEGSQLIDMSELGQFRTISSDREAQYRMYDEMALDSIIATALEMYADDATQYNNKGEVIWAESEDTDVAAFANRLIDVLNLNNDAWSHIYSMCKYGDLYLETFYDDEIDDDPLLSKQIGYASTVVQKHKIGAQMEEYVEAVANPAEIFDLTKRGKTVGFIKVPMEDASPLEPRYSYQHIEQGEETQVLPADKYVHIALSEATDRFPEKLSFSFRDDSSNSDSSIDDIKTYRYKVNKGKSILHDVFKSYKELKLMEDSLLLNRVTRSSIIRILQVEVGDMPKSQARELLKRIKNIIEQKNYMDKGDGTYQSMASPGPIDNVIYVPTHEGKGNITASNLGGDVDIKSIADLDYFQGKLAGGLKIPRAFLMGQSDDGGGLSSGTALTKLDARYARTVKRIQNAYISGITTLINLFALSKGLEDHVNNFTIKMVSPSTMEDQDRDETFDNHVSMIGNFLDLIGSEEMFNNETRRDVLLYFISNLLNESEVADILEEDKTAEEMSAMEDTLSDNEGSGDFDGNFDTDFESDMGDDFSSDDLEVDTTDNDSGDFESEQELSDETLSNAAEEFGDFTDEFNQ